MSKTTMIGCACGKTRLEVYGAPMIVSECLCNSCRAAAGRLADLPGAKNMLTPYQATPSAEYRKDRVRILSGQEHLKEFRLTNDAGSRRVVATCCNTPVFLEMKGAHWLSVYLHLWPDNAAAESRAQDDDRRFAGSIEPARRHPQPEDPYGFVLREAFCCMGCHGFPQSEGRGGGEDRGLRAGSRDVDLGRSRKRPLTRPFGPPSPRWGEEGSAVALGSLLSPAGRGWPEGPGEGASR